MVNKHKSLTVAEFADVPVYEFRRHMPLLRVEDEGLYVRHSDYIRLLSILQPPADATGAVEDYVFCADLRSQAAEIERKRGWAVKPPADAAVREAVRYFDDLRGEWSDEQLEEHLETLLSYVRAAQAQRHDGERLEALKRFRDSATSLFDSATKKARMLAELESTFPELGE